MAKNFKVDVVKGTSVNTIFNEIADDVKVTISEAVDKFGIKMIYPTKDQEWYVDMANPAGTDRFTNLPTLYKVTELDDIGNTQCFETRANQVRMEANSISGQKALNVEITGYCKWVSGTASRIFQTYGGRGGHHTDRNQCLGSAYKSCLNADGTIEARKEITHPAYAGDKATVKILSSYPKGKWIGIKTIIYNIVENSKIYPKIEIWVDIGCDNVGKLVIKGNEDRWKKVTEYIDRGGWNTTNSDFNTKCPSLDSNYTHQYRQRDEILNTSGNVGVAYNLIGCWRTDGIVARWKYLSSREIIA